MIRIKELRIEHNLSQKALAEKIGSSQKAVDYWEKGGSEPTAGFIVAIANCFGCTTDYLLGREDDYGNINVDSDLASDEKVLLSLYRTLGSLEKKELTRYARFIKNDK